MRFAKERETLRALGIADHLEFSLMQDPVAYAQARLKAAGIDSPRFEAQLLAGMVLGISRTAVTAQLHPQLSPSQFEMLRDFITRRENREPLAYIRTTQDFYGREFSVSPEVLIPRPETEMLVDFALERTPDRLPFRFAEVGTGSGCIAISILIERPLSTCIAVDISEEALRIARKNAEKQGVVDRLELKKGDMLKGFAPDSFDLILSNPPYIPTGVIPTLQPEVRLFEPKLALDGGEDGLELYRRLTSQAAMVLRPGGWVAVEIGMGQSEEVTSLFASASLRDIETRLDLAGIERVALGRR